jgi:hypothetical protein
MAKDKEVSWREALGHEVLGLGSWNVKLLEEKNPRELGERGEAVCSAAQLIRIGQRNGARNGRRVGIRQTI